MRSECTVIGDLQKQRALLAFELDQYLTQCVDQLDADKLSSLLKLNYSIINDTMAELGDAVQVRQASLEMQQHLYAVKGH